MSRRAPVLNALLGDRERLALALRGDGEGVHYDRLGRLHVRLETGRLTRPYGGAEAAILEAGIGDDQLHGPRGQVLEEEAAGAVREHGTVQRRDAHDGALKGVAGGGTDHRAGDGAGPLGEEIGRAHV